MKHPPPHLRTPAENASKDPPPHLQTPGENITVYGLNNPAPPPRYGPNNPAPPPEAEAVPKSITVPTENALG